MKRLYRTQYDRKISGVCGGIAQYLGFDPTIVRLAVVILALVTAGLPFVIGYLIAIFIMPNEQDLLD